MFPVQIKLFILEEVPTGIARETKKFERIATKELHLPFAPYDGLCINYGGFMAPQVNLVEWNIASSTFVCLCDRLTIETIRNSWNDPDIRTPPETIEEWVKLEEQRGWSFVEPYPVSRSQYAMYFDA